jgi:hypothetical protein
MSATRKDQHFAVLVGLQQEMERCVLELFAKKEDVEEESAEAPMSAYVWTVERHHHVLLKSQMIVSVQ